MLIVRVCLCLWECLHLQSYMPHDFRRSEASAVCKKVLCRCIFIPFIFVLLKFYLGTYDQTDDICIGKKGRQKQKYECVCADACDVDLNHYMVRMQWLWLWLGDNVDNLPTMLIHLLSLLFRFTPSLLPTHRWINKTTYSFLFAFCPCRLFITRIFMFRGWIFIIIS